MGLEMAQNRAVPVGPTEAQRLPQAAKSVSKAGLSLFTRSSSETLRSKKLADFQEFAPPSWPKRSA